MMRLAVDWFVWHGLRHGQSRKDENRKYDNVAVHDIAHSFTVNSKLYSTVFVRILCMKLRIRNNSLRLRLTQNEVERFAADGMVETAVGFGPAIDQRLVYRILRDDAVSSISAELANNQINIRIPATTAAEWSGTKKVGMETDQDIGNGLLLNILIEKDFARLKPRSVDDVMDKFPNPRAAD